MRQFFFSLQRHSGRFSAFAIGRCRRRGGEEVFGAIAQLGERLNGIQEVGGSIPPGSTKFFKGLAGIRLTPF